jgi:CBS domain-containing membrane protein
MKKNESISHVMTRDVQTVNLGQKPSEARAMLATGGFHHLPVVDGKRLVGILSATDFLRVSLSSYGGGDDRALDAFLDQQFSVNELMQHDVTSLSEGASVREAAGLLHKNAFHALPIVDADSNLAGIVTTTDLLGYLLEQY